MSIFSIGTIRSMLTGSSSNWATQIDVNPASQIIQSILNDISLVRTVQRPNMPSHYPCQKKFDGDLSEATKAAGIYFEHAKQWGAHVAKSEEYKEPHFRFRDVEKLCSEKQQCQDIFKRIIASVKELEEKINTLDAADKKIDPNRKTIKDALLLYSPNLLSSFKTMSVSISHLATSEEYDVNRQPPKVRRVESAIKVHNALIKELDEALAAFLAFLDSPTTAPIKPVNNVSGKRIGQIREDWRNKEIDSPELQAKCEGIDALRVIKHFAEPYRHIMDIKKESEAKFCNPLKDSLGQLALFDSKSKDHAADAASLEKALATFKTLCSQGVNYETQLQVHKEAVKKLLEKIGHSVESLNKLANNNDIPESMQKQYLYLAQKVEERKNKALAVAKYIEEIQKLREVSSLLIPFVEDKKSCIVTGGDLRKARLDKATAEQINTMIGDKESAGAFKVPDELAQGATDFKTKVEQLIANLSGVNKERAELIKSSGSTIIDSWANAREWVGLQRSRAERNHTETLYPVYKAMDKVSETIASVKATLTGWLPAGKTDEAKPVVAIIEDETTKSDEAPKSEEKIEPVGC